MSISAVAAAGKYLIRALDDVLGSMLGNDSDHDPSQVGKLRQSIDVLDELASVGAVLVAVIDIRAEIDASVQKCA
jgi:hypothetical protein